MSERNEYKIPATLHFRAAWAEMWPLLVFLVPLFAVTCYVSVVNGLHDGGSLAMWALCCVTTGMGAYGFRWAWKNRAVVYATHGVTCIWAAHEWYVPPDVYGKFIEEQVDRPFAPLVSAEKVSDLTAGVAVLFEGAKPYAPVREEGGKLAVRRVWGATDPYIRYSRVSGARRLDPGVDGYELKLHACHYLFPGRSEAVDLKWMKDKGILGVRRD
jgi:hypothetical protein